MPKVKPDHHDRGDGVCNKCYEEWPCGASMGMGYMRSGVLEYEEQIRQGKMEARYARDKVLQERIVQACKLTRTPLPYQFENRFGRHPHVADNFYFDTQEFITLMDKVLKSMNITTAMREVADKLEKSEDPADRAMADQMYDLAERLLMKDEDLNNTTVQGEENNNGE